MTDAARHRLRIAGVTLGSALIIIAATWCAVAIGEAEISIGALATFLLGGGVLAGTLRATDPPDVAPPSGDLDRWDLLLAWSQQHGALPGLLVLTGCVGVMYAAVFYGETVGDDLTFHMAESARIADCLRAGDWDLWNPSANGGYASAYYYQVLPQLASAVPTALFGHHLFWFQVSLWLPLVLTPLAAYRGMRLLGATPWQSLFGAFAVVFVSGQSRWGSGADGTFQVGLYTQTWALAVFPIGLGHGVKWISGGGHLASAIAWGALVFLCHPFASIALCLGLAVGVLAHYLAFPVRSRLVKIVLLVIVGGAFAVTAYAMTDSPKIIYIAPLIFLCGVLVRIAARGRLYTALLLTGVGLAILVNAAALGLELRKLYLVPLVLLASIAGRLVLELRRPVEEPSGRAGHQPFTRLTILGIGVLLATLPGWLTVIVDLEGFGGFPHRVNDEVGPGYRELMAWYGGGKVLDFGRFTILTWLLPIVIVFARVPFLRWLWAPAIVYAALLALGPHTPKTADDLLPAVRFLGAMQVVLALGIGAGAFAIGRSLWDAQVLFGTAVSRDVRWSLRTGLAALATALMLLVALMGAQRLTARVAVLPAYDYRDEMMTIIDAVKLQPPGRKQVGPGCENHWWNLLSYVYAKRPSLLQMGGGGLQASPNYDFLWSVRDFPKLAWVYDTPLFVFARANAATAPAGETLLQTTRYELRRLASPGLVSPVEVTGVLPAGRVDSKSPVRKAAIEWLKSDLPFANKVLAYDGHGTSGQPPEARVIRAFRVDPSPGDSADVYAEVDVAQRSTFVLRESWHPRWRAYIDGVAVPLRRVTPDFPAIDVEPGAHVLAFRFERPWWAHAAWLLWPAASVAGWFGVRMVRRRRERARIPQARVLE